MHFLVQKAFTSAINKTYCIKNKQSSPAHIFILFLPIYILLCFICIFLHCPLSGPVMIYISLLIISCIIKYVTNKRTLITTVYEMCYINKLALPYLDALASVHSL